VLQRLKGHAMETVVVFDLATGLRRGELLALRLSDVDLDKGTVRVERSVEETKAGLRFKPPKTDSGERTISIPSTIVAMLREHRRALLELRLAIGLGRPDEDALLFPLNPEGDPIPPNRLSTALAGRLQVFGPSTVGLPLPQAYPRQRPDRCRSRCGRHRAALGSFEPDRDTGDLRPLVR